MVKPFAPKRLEFFRFQQHVHEIAENQYRNDEEDNHKKWVLNFFKIVGGSEEQPEADESGGE
jgi:hypothetical protein